MENKEVVPSTGFIKLQGKIDNLVSGYLASNPDIVKVAQAKDPALNGKTPDQVRQELASYPGIVAYAAHEEAHKLYKTGDPMKKVQARELAEASHSRTGIDIHPGARVGKNCFIDHGTGIVVGETSVIRDDTMMYHGVTLGAYGVCKPEDRHPKIGSKCVISVGAEILGNITIGDRVLIGPRALLCGNNISVGDRTSIGNSAKIYGNSPDGTTVSIGSKVKIGSGAQIYNGNIIADGVKIGEGAIINANTGRISQNIPAYSQVYRDKSSDELKIVSLMESERKLGLLERMIDSVQSAMEALTSKPIGHRFSHKVQQHGAGI